MYKLLFAQRCHLSDSYTKVTPSKYAPVVEMRRRKKKKKEEKMAPPIVNRFPGGGFAARMKKVMEEKQGKGGSKTEMLLVTSTATSTRKKNTSGKESAAKEAAIVKCVKKERKEKNQLKIQSCVRSSPVVGKDEEVVIEDFDSQELLHEAPVGGFSGNVKTATNVRKVGRLQGQDKGKGEKIDGLLPGASSSKTVVINSQPQFAPSQLYEERKVLGVGRPKDFKRGILKKCVPLMNSTRKGNMLEEELSIINVLEVDLNQGSDALAGMLSDIEKEEEQEDILSGRGGDAAADEGGKVKEHDLDGRGVQQGGKVREHDQSLEVDAAAEVFGEENRESSQEEILEEDVDALADLFSDYEVEDGQEQGSDTDAKSGA